MMADDTIRWKVMAWEAGTMVPVDPPRGMYRRTDGQVLVRWEKSTGLMLKDQYQEYEKYGSRPAYEELPSEAEWELQWNADRT
jgi:hypothetical protein